MDKALSGELFCPVTGLVICNRLIRFLACLYECTERAFALFLVSALVAVGALAKC